MGSEEDIARTLSTINARIDTPLTQEQERIVQKMLRSQPMPLGPLPTRGQRLFFHAELGGTALIAILMALSLLNVLPRPRPEVFIAVPIVLTLGSHALRRWHDRFTRRSILELLEPHQGFLCLRCHYPLTSLPDTGQCPECGSLYQRGEVVQRWKSAYQLKNDWPTSSRPAADL